MADSSVVTNTKCLEVTVSHSFLVSVDAEEALYLLDPDCDITDKSDHFTRWMRIAHQRPDYVDGDIDIADPLLHEDSPDGWPQAIHGNGREGYLWSARHFVIQARHELASGRYREGNCRELDAVAGELCRMEDRLRLMAMEVENPCNAEVLAWRQGERATGEAE